MVAVLLVAAAAMPVASAAHRVKTLTLSEATAKAAEVGPRRFSADRDAVLRETGYSTLPCARVSRLKFRCGLVVFYEICPEDATERSPCAGPATAGSSHPATSLPPPDLKTLTVEEANG